MEWLKLASGDSEPTCQLLGPVSVVLQLFLGAIAIMTLVMKRKYESPRRPWRIWFFDISKQVIGALALHTLNLLASIMFSREDVSSTEDNPCVWYFLNVLFDTTIGIPLLWATLWWCYRMAYACGMTQILSGEYGSPPRKRAFFKQLGLYLLALMIAKVLLYVVVYTVPFLDDWGEFLLDWTYQFDPRVQISFVMFVFPTVMNSIQYLVVDSIIQSPSYGVASSRLPQRLRGSTAQDYGTFEQLRARVKHHSSSPSLRNESLSVRSMSLP